MQRLLLPFIGFLAGILVWAVLSWPLPIHFSDAISRYSTNPEGQTLRTMPPGDHLQLLYHFSLVTDMIRGETPWFTNLYEFNTGNDAERYRPGPWFMPFSLVHAIGELIGGKAFGFNLAVLLASGLMGGFTFLLARRYCASPLLSSLASLYALLIPYRQVVLLGGSPTGFAMTFVPAFVLGLDIAVRDRRGVGGWLAGLAVLGTISDFHVLYYIGIFGGVFFLLSLIAGPRNELPPAKGGIRSLFFSLAPAIGLALFTAVLRWWWSYHLHDSTAIAARSLDEIRLFSPQPWGIFNFTPQGSNHLIHLGGWLLLFSGAGLIANLWLLVRQRAAGSLRHFLLILSSAFLLASFLILALGTNDPGEGLSLLAARKIFPLYNKIRQPAKIFCLVPPLLTILLAVSFTQMRVLRPLRARWGIPLFLFIGVGLLVHFAMQITPAIARIQNKNPVWTAAASDSLSAARPHILAIPFWPGDSTWSSIYEHYALAHHLRMINGYSPVVPKAYLEEVWQPLVSINQGELRDDQISLLQKLGVTHLIVHEDAFPEKVSPFPVAATLEGLITHPHLTLIAHDGPVWGFRLQASGKNPEGLPEWSWRFPNRMQTAASAHPPPPTSGPVSITPGTTLTGRSFAASPKEDLYWLVLLRGEGRLRVATQIDDQNSAPQEQDIPHCDWSWHSMPIPKASRYARFAPRFTGLEGTLEIDRWILAAGPPLHEMQPGESIELPPAVFYHAGWVDISTHAIHFRKDWEPDGHVLYGPRLPLAPGEYEVTLNASSDSHSPVELGTLGLRQPMRTGRTATVRSGEPTSLVFSVDSPQPVEWSFQFSRKADCAVESIRLTRLK